ncbi:tachylectin-related carbohydrate-binding protein [Phytohabitans sp. ZYX-F-186]|uniref:Tachylectin-related carbohydrate-binding protein n=1 Tax=Phytohabitans maris TaxID=3071409 RepID=A0ABU0ZFF0_9ACTN|nr:FG-GAP-like repeat-containing protein [Phytohabitans sp. ZYX-F-186]MDQ7905788.1 tachylectin-related carbohydrate-binding protein [Phytohabitans sp. ZYX-F-186]
MRIRRLLGYLGVTASMVLASIVLVSSPAHALSTRPCDPNGTTASDANVARRLNQTLTGGMRGNMTAYNVSCARTIATVINGRGLPVRAAHIAITTTVVESTIHNYTAGDRDSLGLFQQRPSQGWGTPEQIMNPVYATNRFIDAMLGISDWRTGPIGRICQDVQRSGFPDRYYTATNDGIAIANAVWAITGPEPQVGHSITGDTYTDLAALKADGTMWLYSNNFARDGGRPYGDVRQIGHGWNAYDRLVPADATGDGYTDLVALKPDGTMWLFSNNFVRDGGWPYGDVRQIGHGWNAYDRIIAADATGDGFTDLVALKPDGTMWLFSNNFVRDGGQPYGDVRQIGQGWNGFDRIVASDATGDGYADLVALKPDGTMWLYSNNFERDGGWPYSDVRQIGQGWNGFDRIVASDATGDGFTDLVALKPDGTMWLYSNNFVRDGGRPYSDVRQIGQGWNTYNRIIA